MLEDWAAEVLKGYDFKELTHALHPGVYVLIRKGKIAYVGKSMEPFGRIGSHTRNISFDRVLLIRCRRDELIELESKLINDLKPYANRNPYGCRPDSEKRVWIEPYHMRAQSKGSYRFKNDKLMKETPAVSCFNVNGNKVTLKKKATR